MHNRKLLNLLAQNARKGQFRAEGNTIWLYDMIVASDEEAAWFGGVSAESFVKELGKMSGDVALRINSPGGDVFGAKAMAQAIREYGGNVTAHVDGYAASAATFLTSVAHETLMAPGSMLMIHKAWTIAFGNADDFVSVAGLLEKIDGTIADEYAASAARRGKEGEDVSSERFAELMSAETWFTAKEAIEAGLADEEAAETPKATIDWDLSAFEHAPALTLEEPKAPDDAGETEAAAEAAAAAEANEIEAKRRQRLAALRLKVAA